LWGDIERQLPDGAKLPFDRAAVIDRFEANAKAVLDGRSWSDKMTFAKELAREVAYYRNLCGQHPPRAREVMNSANEIKRWGAKRQKAGIFDCVTCSYSMQTLFSKGLFAPASKHGNKTNERGCVIFC
jgi:hypothetical protein